MTPYSATAKAQANIALAKYWGKANVRLNLPAVPSLSMTLEGLSTTTQVTFDPKLKKDSFILNQKKDSGKSLERVTQLLDLVRSKTHLTLKASVISENNFPTAAGLASSASGFCALAAAACEAAEHKVTPKELSQISRQSSASAARSVFGGFVELDIKPANTKANTGFAKQIENEKFWDLCIVVAVIETKKKSMGSTAAMERAKKTSPLYQAWLESAPALFRKVKKSLLQKDLDSLGEAMEKSTFAFHATTWTSSPSFSYWQPGTIEALSTIRNLREQKGVSVWATMDAGPNVKAFCHFKDAKKVQSALQNNSLVKNTLIAKPGEGVKVWRP